MLNTLIDKTDIAPSPVAHPPLPRSPNASGALAKTFVEMLLADAGKPPAAEKSTMSRGKDYLAEFGLFEADDPVEASPVVTLALDDAAVAVLLASQLEMEPGLLRGLRKDSPSIVVQAPDERTRTSVEYVLRACCLGRSTHVLSNSVLDSLSLYAPSPDRRYAVILNCEGDNKRVRADTERRALAALSLAVPVCAVAVDAMRTVPEQLRSVADRIIVLGGWNRAHLAVLIEGVTGTPIDVPDEAWVSVVTLDDLRMSVSAQRGATGSLERLRSTVLRRQSKATDLPHVSDLHGYGEAQRIAVEMLADLRDYRDGKIGWDAMPRGFVMAGPTGVGKTFFARCFARSADLPLVIGSLAQWQSAGDGYLGDCLSAMKKTFTEARNSAPCVLFIDEIDSIGDRNTFHHRHKDYSSQVVNCLLEELDGASDRNGVIVLAATNHISRIDSAILRPGRLDRVVEIEMPDVPALAGILRTQLGHDLPAADLMPVALACRGGSGASVASWVRQARGIARRAGRDVEVEDLLAAVRDGREVLPETTRRRVALHEAAHAAAVVALDMGVVDGVSVHDAGGTTVVRPAARTTTRDEAIAVLVHLLAGRAAERHFLGTVSAGAGGNASSDLALATRTAIAIEGSWGLGDAGALWYGDFGQTDMTSMTLTPTLFASVRRLLRHCETEAERFVAENEGPILRCSERLEAAGHLDAAEVLDALGPVAPFLPSICITAPSDGSKPI